VTERTRVKRHPERAVYNREEIAAILDEGYICHVAFVVDQQPHLIPQPTAEQAIKYIFMARPQVTCCGRWHKAWMYA